MIEQAKYYFSLLDEKTLLWCRCLCSDSRVRLVCAQRRVGAQVAPVVPFAICIAFVLLSAFLVLGPYQSDNDDFAQYALHAQNILQGRKWDYLLAGYPVVFPGYPLLLAAIFKWIGFSVYAVGVLNSILWAIYSYTFFIIFRSYFRYQLSAWLALAAVAFCPFILAFQQEGLPNIFSSAATAAALYGALVATEQRRLSIGVCLLIVFPALIRLDAIALYAAIGLYALLRRYVPLVVVCGASLMIVVVLDTSISSTFQLNSSFQIADRVADAASPGDLFGKLRALTFMFADYILSISEWVTGERSHEAIELFSVNVRHDLAVSVDGLDVILLGLLFVGLAQQEVLSLTNFFLIFHLGLISAFLLIGGGPIRYLAPVYGIIAFSIVLGIERSFCCLLGRRQAAVGVCMMVLLLCVIFITAGDQLDVPRRRNYLYIPSFNAAVVWLAEHAGDHPVANYKARSLSLLLDQQGKEIRVRQIRDLRAGMRFVLSDGLLLVRKTTSRFGQKQLYRALLAQKDVGIVWQDDGHAIFARLPLATEERGR